MISHDSVVTSGSSNILELPISAALIPFIGTTMRISPLMTKIVQKYLYRESKRTDKPVVFLFHPNECLDVGDRIKATRRTKNPIEILASASEYGFEFVSAGEYTKLRYDEISNL